MNLFLFFLVLSFSLAQEQDALHIDGKGASLPATIYQEAIFASKFVLPNVKLDYEATGSGKGKQLLKGNDNFEPQVITFSFPPFKVKFNEICWVEFFFLFFFLILLLI